MPQYSLKRWKEIVDTFYDKYQGLKKWWDRNETLARLQGYIRTPSGRVITLPKIVDGDEGSEAHWQHAVRNYPVQSFSADLYNLAVVTIVNRIKELGLDANLIMLVHDSCVFEVSKADAPKLAEEGLNIFSNIKELCKQQFDYDIVVPLGGDCEVGLDYGSLKGTSLETIKKDIEELYTCGLSTKE